jgi:hypothetical protein
LSASVVGTTPFTIVSVPTTGSLTNPDLEGVRGYNVSGTGISTVYPEFTRISSDAAHVEFLVHGTVAVPVLRYSTKSNQAQRHVVILK